MDSFRRVKEKVAVMLHLTSSREKVAGGLESQAIASVIVECRSTAETSRRDNAAEGISE